MNRPKSKVLARCARVGAALLSAGLIALPVLGDEKKPDTDSLQREYEKLSRELEEVREALARMQQKMDEASKAQEEEAAEEKKTDDAASKPVTRAEIDELKTAVERVETFSEQDSIVHLGGYTHVGIAKSEGGNSSATVGAFAPIFHYQYKDRLLMETELEVELGEDGDIKLGLEYLTLDLFLNDYLVLVVGKFISPIGQFRQNLHPSWINKLPSAPIGFGHDGATPISETGVQLRGGAPIGSWRTNFAFYVANGPEIRLEPTTGGGHAPVGPPELEIVAEGQARDVDGNKAFGGRFGLMPSPNFEIGVSAAVSSVQFENEAERDYDVIGADFYFRPRFLSNFVARGEYVKTTVGAGGVTAPEAVNLKAWYMQGTYHLGGNFESVLRYGEFNRGESAITQWVPGINYYIANNIIAKIAYEINDSKDPVDQADRMLMQLTYGF